MTKNLSFKNRSWKGKKTDPNLVKELITIGYPSIIAEMLAARDMGPQEAINYFNGSIPQFLPDATFFKGMNEAVDRIVDGIKKSQNIAIWGDYDVDGATSTAIMHRTLKALQIDAEIYIPDRITEGYGPNITGLQGMKDRGIDLVIVLDAGTTAFEPLEYAKSIDLDVVVIDHHAAEDKLPEAISVVNPNRKDQEPGFGHLCAAGMTWIVCREIAFEMPNPPTQVIMNLLDLVALGTVCDVVPLTNLNRAFVKEGLKIMDKGQNAGIHALRKVCEIDDNMRADHCGFRLGPRINAGGRVADSKIGANLLSSNDPDYCEALAKDLNEMNGKRQELEAICLKQATDMAEAQSDNSFIFTLGDDWHEGIIGIVAGRLKEVHDKPALVFAKAEDGLAKGSGRSVPGFDLGAAVIEARQQGLLVKGGGHGMAAGATIELDKVEAFKNFLDQKIAESDFAKNGIQTPYDAVLPLNQATTELVEQINKMQPFGQGNPKPRFMIEKARITKVIVMKEKHLKVILQVPGRDPISALMFNASTDPVFHAIHEHQGSPIDFIVTLGINEWMGKTSVQAMIEDARLSA